MGTTSLAEQLKRLATPQTSLYIQKKKKPSLLFDPAEAANIDRDAFYEIGISGLKDLIQLNECFAKFKYSLFDETSKSFERAVETSDANKKLDETLKEFLYLLSPYFLLRQSQKALEWLIVRFRIHQHNVDELLCMALPYHGTRIFARLIQLLEIKDSESKWNWLYPIQKKGVPLSKTALLNHCASDMSFLKLICVMTVDTVEIFGDSASKLSTLFAFYSTTVTGALQNISNVNNLHLTHILPSIMYGLRSNCVDFIASAFIIIGTLSSKISFEQRLFNKFVIRITNIKTENLYSEMILILNILYQSENMSTATVPQKSIKTLIERSDRFIPALCKFLSAAVYTNVFYTALVRDTLKLIKKNHDKDNVIEINFIDALIKHVRVDDKSAETLIRLMIEAGDDDSDQWYCELVQSLEYQYPDSWDNVLPTLIKEQQSDIINHLLGFTSVASHVQIFQKLNDTNPFIRAEVIKYIADNPNSFKARYLETSLKERWKDDEPSVIEAMFKLPQSLRYYSLDTLKELLTKCWQFHDSQSHNVLSNTIKSITEFYTEHNESFCIILLLPFLLSSSSDIQQLILDIDVPFFNLVKENYKQNAYSSVIEVLKNMCCLPPVEDLLLAYEELPKESIYTFSLLLIFSSAFQFVDWDSKHIILSFVFKRSIPQYIEKIMDKGHPVKWKDKSLTKYFQKTKENDIPSSIFQRCITSMINGIKITENLIAAGWLDFSNECLNTTAELYSNLIILSSSTDSKFNIFDSYVDSFVKVHLSDLPSCINFMCNICTYFKCSELQKRTFTLMNKLLQSADESLSWVLTLSVDNIVVPTVLISLSSSNEELRSLAMDTIALLSHSIGPGLSNNTSYLKLLEHLLSRKEEILLDKDQLSLSMYTFLSQDKSVQDLLPISVQVHTEVILDQLLDVCTNDKTPITVTCELLKILEYLNSTDIIKNLIPFVMKIINENSGSILTDEEYVVTTNIMDKFNSLRNDIFKEPEIRTFVEFCLNDSHMKVNPVNNLYLYDILFSKLSDEIFDSLDYDSKEFILKSVIDCAINKSNSEVLSAVNSFIKKITVNCELIVKYLEHMVLVDTTIEETFEYNKDVELANVLKVPEWKKGILILEILQNKKKLNSTYLIIPILFEILHKCMEIEEHLSMEYTKQVCLTCILNCTGKLNFEECDEKTVEKLFNIELVVNCIRVSQNPQTHHHALMVLSHCALFAPEQVLHNIMGIFTFMGSSVLRQDDSFSFQIISNIMEIIVPLLVKSKINQTSDVAVFPVLNVFAASMLDIPHHRRMPLLEKLIKIIGEEKYLSSFVILVLEFDIMNTESDKPRSSFSKRVEILQHLCSSFEPYTILKCCEQLLFQMNILPHEKDETDSYINSVGNGVFNVGNHTNKELRHFKYMVLSFISNILSGNRFITQITSNNASGLKLMDNDFKNIIEQTLVYICSVMKHNLACKTGSSKYWKALTFHSLEILNKANALLTSMTFLNISQELLNHKVPLVRRKIMELLNWRLQQPPDDYAAINPPDGLIPIMFTLVNKILVSTHDSVSEYDQTEAEINQQMALISLKLITKYCNTFDHVDEFKKVLVLLSCMLNKNLAIHDPVLACLVLCIAELISSLKVHAIESVPKFFPALITLLKNHNNETDIKSDIVLLSLISALQKIVESLPNFLSPYLESILYEISVLTAKLHCQYDTNKLTPFLQKLNMIRQKISSEIASRVLLPSISNCLTRLFDNKQFGATKYLMDTLAESFETNSTFSTELTNLFLNSLELRCKAESLEDSTIDEVETYIINALCVVVLKCSESAFRPFYHKLYDWGIVSSKYDNQKEKTITYYRVMSAISENLKSLFVLFASNFIRNGAELLDKNNIIKYGDDNIKMYFGDDVNKSVVLVDAILKTFYNVFKHNSVKFVTKERFNILVDPLVNQAENTIGDYEKRSDLIVNCVAHFAAATTDDSLWKQFVYSILLKTRHSSFQVRLVALETVCKFATLLGDNFLPFLPETVPFLAELLEDENEVVEKRTQKAIQKLESVLGEPIQKYF